MKRRRHPNKDVEAVLRELETLGWSVTVRSSKGHAWGLLRCPNNDKECRCGEYCQMSVSSTPQNPRSHAAKLRGKALGCIHVLAGKDEESDQV
jgi:hypothetical protein